MNLVFSNFIKSLLSPDHEFIFSKVMLEFLVSSDKSGELVSNVQSSAKIVNLDSLVVLIISFMNIIKRSGPRTVPWGTPLVMRDNEDFLEFIATYWNLLFRS